MAEYRVPSTTKVEGLIATHAATPHGGIDEAAALLLIADDDNLSAEAQAVITAGACDTDANLSVAAQAVVTAGACDVDANLSAAAQSAITASHTAPTYDGVNDEIVFTI